MKKLLTLILAFTATTVLCASNTITYTATEKLSNSKLNIGENTFGYSITSHTFTNGVGTITCDGEITTIGESAFESCGLTSIIIPNSVTTIKEWAFAFCRVLTSVEIPNSVITIDEYSFLSCTSLNSVILGNSVTTIGESAFEDCKVLSSITIPNSVTMIEKRAFYACPGLTSVSIGASVTMIDDEAFVGCTSLPVIDNIRYADTYLVESVDKTKSSYTIKEGTKWIANSAFRKCSNLTSIDLPNNLIMIGECAFCGCSKLTSITIPNSVTTIGRRAFDESGLTYITIGNSITYIGEDAFSDCTNLSKTNYTGTVENWCNIEFVDEGANPMAYSHGLFINDVEVKDLVIPNGVTSINDYAFFGGSGFTSISIPNSVITIGEEAFLLCTGLTSLAIPNSVISIGDGAFYGCSGLTSVTIGNSVTTMGDEAFDECTALPIINNIRYADTYLIKAVDKTLSSYTIKEGTKWIARGAFIECSNLTSIDLPNDLIMIGESAFCDCSSLTSIEIPNSVTSIGDWAFCRCSSLTSINIPNSISTIGAYTFYYCSSLISITIPNSVTEIGIQAFEGCSSMNTITIGNSIKVIGNDAFRMCGELRSFTCFAANPPRYIHSFKVDFCSELKVYVLASSLEAYQNADVWRDLTLVPIGAEVTSIDNEESIVEPTNNDVTITWPITDGTDTYTLTITKNGETVCVLTFNANGQLTNIAFAAPGHNGAHQAPAATLTAQGYQFTVTGLNPGTAYNYSVTATDAGGQTLAEHKGNFSTTGGTGFEPVHGSQATPKGLMHKVLRNGQIMLERNNATYTLMGQKVK